MIRKKHALGLRPDDVTGSHFGRPWNLDHISASFKTGGPQAPTNLQGEYLFLRAKWPRGGTKVVVVSLPWLPAITGPTLPRSNQIQATLFDCRRHRQ
jgi:hypothetical protein